MTGQCHFGDVFDVLPRLAGLGARCCVTSPPYWGLRDYKADGQLGLEPTPEEYVAKMVAVFREVRRVLKDDGTLWLNLGDTYANTPVGKFNGGGFVDVSARTGGRDMSGVATSGSINKWKASGLKQKDLVGIPWRVAFALQADGWWLRQDIIWHKPNPMPESVTDRCTKAHEYLFLLAKSERYYYNAEAVSEPVAPSSIERLSQAGIQSQAGSDRVPGKTNGPMKAAPPRFGGSKYGDDETEQTRTKSGNEWLLTSTRNRRSVWTVATQPYSRAHFATFPPDLIKPCILAGSAPGDIVLDPFLGSGTTAMVAQSLGRRWVGVELNETYKALQDERISQYGLAFNTNEETP